MHFISPYSYALRWGIVDKQKRQALLHKKNVFLRKS